MNLLHEIRKCIEKHLELGQHNFIIYPFGAVGIQVKHILNVCYGIQEKYIIDNQLCKYNSAIKSTDFLQQLSCENYTVILSSTNTKIYDNLKSTLLKFFPNDCIAELSSMTAFIREHWTTQIGKYSYGPLCRNHPYIESIGAFCSFAAGTSVVENHAMNYITTHPMIYIGQEYENININFTEYKNKPYYFEGVQPKAVIHKMKRCKIGNDVWLGKNVIITNGSSIGNGVIAGAGSVITKDIPDYAIVAGTPARIIRFRYSPEQITELNKIAWWNWSDIQIKERYYDFYLPIELFIEKYRA